jgi:putative heme-binding domain-containing protein
MMKQFLLIVVVASAMTNPVIADPPDAQAARDATIVQTVLRLKGIDVDGTPKLKAAVLRHLKTLEGKPEYVELIKSLKVRGVEAELLRLAIHQPDSTAGVAAAEILLDYEEDKRINDVIQGKDEGLAANAVAVLGRVGSARALELIQPLVTDIQNSRAVRSAAAQAVGRNLIGQRFLLERVAAGELPQDLNFAVANALFSSPDKEIRLQAAKYLKLPAAAEGVPLPPIAELVKQAGNASRGQQLFKTTGTCLKCHKVRGEGKEVGPDLSEIGSKLSKEAMFVSILDPSAGISHNYESYTVILESGNVVAGIIVSRTDAELTLRNAEAIDKTYQMSDVEELIKSSVSIMPADLQKSMSAGDLVDIVAFISTLKKVGGR